MRLFEGRTADEAWSRAATAFLVEGEAQEQASRAGPTREILHAAFAIRNPLERWVLARRPTINPAFAIAETVWILAGRDDSALPNHWNPELPKYTGPGERYHGAYGHRLRRRFGLDQLERAYIAHKNNPDSRQVVLQNWDPKIDLPDEEGRPAAQDVPCNVLSMLKVRKGRLEWAQVMRSNDLFRGVPYNFVQFTVLQEVMAGWLSLEVGAYDHVSDSLHVYEGDFEALKGFDTRVQAAPNTHSLRLLEGGVGRSLRGAREATGCDDCRLADRKGYAEAVGGQLVARSLSKLSPGRRSGLRASKGLDRLVGGHNRTVHRWCTTTNLGGMGVEDGITIALFRSSRC